MVRFSTKYKHQVILLFVLSILIIPLPMMMGNDSNVSSPIIANKISVELSEIISDSAQNEMLPIYLKFDMYVDSVQIQEIINSIDSPDISLQHIFDLIPYASIRATPAGIEALGEILEVQLIGFDETRQIVPLDVEFQPALNGDGLGYVHSDEILSADAMWAQGYDGTGVTVAILDSGVMGSHEDLDGQIIGFYDVVNTPHETTAYDDNGHGTACAWLVAGSGDGNGGIYTGMAPGADLLIVKVLDSDGGGLDSHISQGIEYAVAQGADIISLSLGGEWVDSSYDDPTVNAIEAAIQAGVTVVIAAGNTGPAVFSINTPAIADEAIVVGASSGSVGVVPFSSRGPLYRSETEPTGYFAKPDIIAPGYQVLTARDDSASTYEYPIYNSTDYGNTYTLFSGTSASAPQIAALAALLLDKHPSLTPTEIKVFLMEGATDLGADPMEQGYGLANVTRSSEIITNTSSMLTLMTPLRYPTLPGTSSVFIMGDDRPDQMVTVISTVNRGSVDIVLQGNASDYVTVSDDTITVSVGYQHFAIGLTIPEDLPLSAVGNYYGNLTLVSGEETFGSIELELKLTAYGGTVLVDMAHHDANDPDDISYYTHFGKFLREQGIIFSELPEDWRDADSSATIDGNSLAGIEVLMIMDTELSYTDTEIESIHEFVEEGGKLLILSEGFDTENNVPAFAFSDYNAILEPYGIQCEENWIGLGGDLFTGIPYGVDYGGAVDDHVLTEGVDNLYILNGGTLSVNSTVAGAQGLLWTDAQRTHALLAYVEKGNGSVIVISDGSTLYDTSIYDATSLGADNLQLLKNIAGQLQTEKPKIYDVELVTGEFGEDANVTAYIFDDDLKQVHMIIEGPKDEVLEIVLTESLGYKFVASFLYESAGFYKITIIAEDYAGHTQTFTKLVFIPIDAADDNFIIMVIIVLLGVVGVGIGYVAILHFGGKRRSRPRVVHVEKEEWTPPWESDSQPPAIE